MTGWPCCGTRAWTSRWHGGAWPTRRPATRRRCVRCLPIRGRSKPGCRAGVSGALVTTRALKRAAPTSAPSAPGACAAPARGLSPATTAWRKRWRRHPTLATLAPLSACSRHCGNPTTRRPCTPGMPSLRRLPSRLATARFVALDRLAQRPHHPSKVLPTRMEPMNDISRNAPQHWGRPSFNGSV